MLITFHLSILCHCVLVQGSLSCCQIFLEIFLSTETVRFPSFEELSNFPQIACSWTFSVCFDFRENLQILSKQHPGFFLTFSEHFCKSFFDQAENGMFLPDRKKYDFNFTSVQKAKIFKVDI